MWKEAQEMYEKCQIEGRRGVLPFTESEYALWEDHWIVCAQKLQQVRSLNPYSEQWILGCGLGPELCASLVQLCLPCF